MRAPYTFAPPLCVRAQSQRQHNRDMKWWSQASVEIRWKPLILFFLTNGLMAGRRTISAWKERIGLGQCPWEIVYVASGYTRTWCMDYCRRGSTWIEGVVVPSYKHLRSCYSNHFKRRRKHLAKTLHVSLSITLIAHS